MKGKRTLLRILIIICALVLLLTAALIWVLPAFSMTGHRQTLEEAFAWQSDHYDTSFYGKLEKTAYTVNAEDGYVLHAELLKNPVETTDYVIISHGYTDNRMGALKYVPAYLDLGFNWHKKLNARAERTFNLSIYNAYNNRNPFLVYVYTKSEQVGDEYQEKRTLRQLTLFPILPSISYAISF